MSQCLVRRSPKLFNVSPRLGAWEDNDALGRIAERTQMLISHPKQNEKVPARVFSLAQFAVENQPLHLPSAFVREFAPPFP